MRKLDIILCRVEEISVSLALILSVLVAFTEVVLRKFFGSSLGFADEAVDFLLIFAGLIGSSIGVRSKTHIGVDVIVKQLPNWWSKVFILVSFAICILFSIIIVYLGIEHVNIMRSFGQVTPELGIPWYIPEMIVPLAFGLMTIRFIQAFVQEWKRSDENKTAELEVNIR